MAVTDLSRFPDPPPEVPSPDGAEQTAVLAGGCFWCVEGVYRQLEGVREVVSGYSGGTAATADYKTVCSGATDHAEAVRIRFDPARLSFGQLLKVFFAVAHDPTQLDRQGADVGRQYRSAIFFADEDQRRVAEAYVRRIGEAGVFGSPIVTQIVPLEAFYEAEAYHQDYAARNPAQPYVACTAIPKIHAVRELFPALVRRR